jgi:hypothetical protein
MFRLTPKESKFIVDAFDYGCQAVYYRWVMLPALLQGAAFFVASPLIASSF